MNVLLDTNVILDLLLERQPFVEDAARLLEAAQETDLTLYLTATTVTDLYDITRKAKDRATAHRFIVELLQWMKVAGVDDAVIREALDADFADFEDAVQASAAKASGIPIIVTRNTADFAQSTLGIYSPEMIVDGLSTGRMGDQLDHQEH